GQVLEGRKTARHDAAAHFLVNAGAVEHQHGAVLGAVTFPDLLEGRTADDEVGRAVDVGQPRRAERAGATRTNVAHEDGPLGRAVALPQFTSVNAIIGGKEQRAVDVGQIVRRRGAAAGDKVLDEDGSLGRAIALPQFATVDAVVGDEVQRAADVHQRFGV